MKLIKTNIKINESNIIPSLRLYQVTPDLVRACLEVVRWAEVWGEHAGCEKHEFVILARAAIDRLKDISGSGNRSKYNNLIYIVRDRCGHEEVVDGTVATWRSMIRWDYDLSNVESYPAKLHHLTITPAELRQAAKAV